MFLAIMGVLSTVHIEGNVTPGGGDYVDVQFEVPENTAEIHISHTDGSEAVILDWGVWGPSGHRGYTGGLTDDIVIGVEQSSRGYLPGPIEPTPKIWTISIGKAQIPATGAHYIIDIVCSTEQTLPVLPKAMYVPVVMAAERRWYKGDFHVHSLQSGDSLATLDQDVALAHSRGIDFINLSDHNTIAQHALVAAQQANWPVLVLRSSEITTYSGHGNGVGIHDYVDHRLGYNGRTMTGIIEDVVGQGGVFIVNHAAIDIGSLCIGCGWKHIDDIPWDKVSALEILTAGYDFAERSYTPRVMALWDELEAQGHRLSAVGGSDDHTAGVDEGFVGAPIGSPTTLVHASELGEAAIIDAVRHQRTMVQLRGPDDPVVELTVKKRDGSLAELGDDVDGIATVDMPIRVTGGNGTFVLVYRDGTEIDDIAVTRDDFTVTAHDVPGAGDHRYRVELLDIGNRRVVVTSHIYVHAGEPESGGCRSTAHGSPAAVLPMLVVGLGRRLRRRRRPSP
jgi:hypothetical protein